MGNKNSKKQELSALDRLEILQKQEQTQMQCIEMLLALVPMYREGINITRFLSAHHQIDRKALVKAKLQTKKAVVPFPYTESVVDTVKKFKNPIFIRGRLCKLCSKEVQNNKNFGMLTRDTFSVFYLREMVLLNRNRSKKKQINKKLLYTRKHPISFWVRSEEGSGIEFEFEDNTWRTRRDYSDSQPFITNKGESPRFIIFYHYEDSSKENFVSASLIDPLRRKTLIRLSQESLQVPDEEYSRPEGFNLKKKLSAVIKFEKDEKRLYSSQLYSSLRAPEQFEMNFLSPQFSSRLFQHEEILKLKGGVGKLGQYYDIMARQVVETGISLERRPEWPRDVGFDQFMSVLNRACRRKPLKPIFFAHKCFHLNIPNTILCVYFDPIPNKVIGLKKLIEFSS